VVQSAAKAEKTSVLVLALGATGLLGGIAALLCTLFPELPLLIIYDRSYLRVAPLVPLYAWCTLPLALSALLVNNLLARERFGIVWWLVASAAGYWVTLRYLHQSFTQVIQVLGFFGTILLAGCALLTWWEAHRRPASGYQEGGTAAETSGRG
jgi:O-antigen/teichoic acid export membrane protein